MDIVYLTLCWIAGIIFAHQTDSNLPLGLVALGISLLWAVIWPHEQLGRWRLMLVGIALFGWGAFRLQEARPEQSLQHISRLNNRGWVRITGIIVEDPNYGDTSIQVKISVESVTWLGRERQAEGIVMVWLPTHSNVTYGDHLLAAGELRTPPRLDDYDYREKLAQQGIHSTMNPDQYRILVSEQGNPIRAAMINVKHQAQESIENALPEPQASLLSGILLGDDSGLSREVKEAFNATGTSHVIAISGFNMTLIAGLIAAWLRRLTTSKYWQVGLGISIIVIYTIFVGGNGAVVRAAIMSSVLITAPLVRRQTYVPASLAFTALIMSIYNPWVLWDIGFQLSFAAVLGMALLTPSLDRGLHTWLQHTYGTKIADRLSWWLSEPLVVSIAAQVFTLPLILYYFERLSPISPLTNFLIVPVQAIILFSGGAATLISFVAPGIGMGLYQIAWLFLTWTTTIVRQSANLSFASVELSLSQTTVLAMAGFVLTITILNAERPPWYRLRQWSMPALLLGATIVGLIMLAALGQRILQQPDGRLHVTYLDMGQSNSALVQTPDGAVILIDGGRYPSRLLTMLDDRLPPHRRIIDVLYITNDAEEDIAGLIEVVERYEIGTVITTVSGSNESRYHALLDAIQNQDIYLQQAEDGSRIETSDEVQLVSLNRRALRLEYGEAVFLFTNELSSEDELELLERRHLVQATVLQAADHAADESNSQKWVDAVDPQVVIVHNDPSHWQPGAMGHVMARLEDRQLYRTDQHGTIEIVTDGETLDIFAEQD